MRPDSLRHCFTLLRLRRSMERDSTSAGAAIEELVAIAVYESFSRCIMLAVIAIESLDIVFPR